MFLYHRKGALIKLRQQGLGRIGFAEFSRLVLHDDVK